MHEVYLAIGSNIDPHTHIPQALELVGETPGLHVARVSTFYCTPPLGRPDQQPYRNGAVRLQYDQDPHRLKFQILRPIEARLGRKRTPDAYAPRPIDLDILLFDTIVQHTDGLTLPDPDIRTRAFVAVPLAELAPDLVLPDTGERLRNLPIIQEKLTTDAPLTRTLKERFNHE
jgi:2-amino-4-hydroxy-6-hydroxymethyldihydropteridine diphosphokinase